MKDADQHMNTTIHFVAQVREFVKDRADLEREYAKRLDNISRKYLPKQRVSLKVEQEGYEIRKFEGHEVKNNGYEEKKSYGQQDINNSHGQQELKRSHRQPECSPSNSTRDLWERILLECTEDSHHHANYADILTKDVLNELKGLIINQDEAKKKQITYSNKCLSERTRLFTRVEEDEKTYMKKCDAVRLSSLKYSRAADEKAKERLNRLRHDDILGNSMINTEMNNSKNLYLLSLNSANSMKRQYYDVVALKNLETIQEHTITINKSILNIWKFMVKLSLIQASARSKMSRNLNSSADATISRLKNTNSSLGVFLMPPMDEIDSQEIEDVSFTQCGLWRDPGTIVTDEYSTVFLHNHLLQLYKLDNNLINNHKSTKKGYEGLSKLHGAYEKNPLQGNAADIKDVFDFW